MGRIRSTSNRGSNVWSLALLCAALAACSGDAGPEGPQGPEGPEGPEGPIAAPPVLTGIDPAWGSALTQVTISGENFGAAPADNRVAFNGWDATVLSATATELVVQPNVATDDSLPTVVSVEVANQVSNGLYFEVVPSGTTRAQPSALPTAPTGVVRVGTDLYVAAGALVSPSAGLYKVTATGVTTRVVAGRRLDAEGGSLFDGPVAVATDGTDVFYTTVFGGVRKYDPSEGTVRDVVSPALGNDGTAFPPRTGLCFDSAGNLYLLDRNGAGDNLASIVRVDPNGGVSDVVDLGGPGYGVASDGTNLFATRGASVVKVTSPAGTPALTLHGASGGANGPAFGITVAAGNAVVSFQTGVLGAVPANTAGAIISFAHPSGYGYPAQGLAATTSGDLYLAQSEASAVRVIANGQTNAVIVAAGTRLAFGTARLGDRWYFATMGASVFSNGPATPAAPDGAVIELGADGSSRVLAVGTLPVDIIATGTDQLTISDCLGNEIYRLVPSTGVTTTVLDAGDGIVCPAGLFAHSSGDLYFVEASFGPGNATISRLAGTTLTQDVITGLPGPTLFLEGIGDDLYAAGLGLSDTNIGTGVWTAVAGTSGAATRLVSDAATGATTALTVGPGDRILMHRFGIGDLLELDPTSGELSPVGSTLIDGLFTFGAGTGSIALSMGFRADGTAVIMDMGQSTLSAVAP